MSLIKFHDQVGLLLDPSDTAALKNVYANMEKRIFPKQRVSLKKTVDVKNNENTFVYSEDIRDPSLFYNIKANNFEKLEKLKNEFVNSNKNPYYANLSNENIINSNSNNINNIHDIINNNLINEKQTNENFEKVKLEYNLMKKEKEKINKISDDNFIRENAFAGLIVQNNSTRRSFNNQAISDNTHNIDKTASNNADNKNYNLNLNAHITVKERMNLATSADSAVVIPEIYKFCTNYLINKYNLEKVDFNILRSIGVCKVFREHFKEKKINSRMDIDYLDFIGFFKELVSENAFKFLEYFASKYKNKDNNMINIQHFFAKMEEVLLQYSKIDN
jgi:hypothetical protein